MTLRISHSRRELIRNAAMIGGAVLAGGIAPRPSQAAPLPEVKPEDIRLDPRRLQVAYDLLEKWTTGPKAPIPGGRFWWAVSGRQWHRGTLADKARVRCGANSRRCDVFTWRR